MSNHHPKKNPILEADTALLRSHRKVLLVSNNPYWVDRPSLQDHVKLQFLEHNALHVLTIARNHIHLGWRLLNHPLYGNFKPYQQPFRSFLIQCPKKHTHELHADSLHLIEQAFTVYNDCLYQIMEPTDLHPKMSLDCAILDMALLDATLEHTCNFFSTPYAPQGVRHAS